MVVFYRLGHHELPTTIPARLPPLVECVIFWFFCMSYLIVELVDLLHSEYL